ncbi:MAG: GIY-YIG nuclease family protein [Desulfomonilaceae bacterium]
MLDLLTRGFRKNLEIMPWFVYIVRCSDDSLYCGTTTNLRRRLDAHNSGAGARYTRSRLPVQLVWHIQGGSKSAAFKEEFRIKRLQKDEKELLVASQPHTEGSSPRAQTTNHESEARLPGATLKTRIP